MIHQARKNEKKDSAILFGVATDGFQYHFWRIDNESNVSCIDIIANSQMLSVGCRFPTATYTTGRRNPEDNTFISIFRAIIRTAILASPTTSPVKGQEFAKHFQHP